MNTKILFLGDVYLTKHCYVKLPRDTFTVFNLEGPISDEGMPIAGKINIKMRKGVIEKVFNNVPAAVSLANNHIMDFGEDAFVDTIYNLKKLNIKYFGAGHLRDNYNNPLILQIGDIRVALLGYCYSHYYCQIKSVKCLKYGPAPLTQNRVKSDVISLRDKADRIVVVLHWGVEESHFPKIEQVRMARKISQLGVDCIVGHHAHVIQPVELYGKSVIAYGLGNFIFSDLDTPAYYNEYGSPTKRIIKKQFAWNKSSIGLLIDLISLDYTVIPFYYAGDRVVIKKTFWHRYSNINVEDKINKLNIIVSRQIVLKFVLSYLCSIFEKRRVPKIKTIKTLVSMLYHKNDNNKR